jgi:hypothetical protein
LISGKDIRFIKIPVWGLDSTLEMQGEFILLSSNADSGQCEVLDPHEEVVSTLPDEIRPSTESKEPVYNNMLT